MASCGSGSAATRTTTRSLASSTAEASVLLVTVDTNALPIDDLLAAVRPAELEFSIVSVTDREVGGLAQRAAPTSVKRTVETAVWGESQWGNATWGDPASSDCLEGVLAIISAGSFPPAGQRSSLTDGQRRQLRDAMIFCAHVQAGRHIFVTNDMRGFVRAGRREQLEREFKTRIMTRDEFRQEFTR